MRATNRAASVVFKDNSPCKLPMTLVSQEPPRCHASVTITPVTCEHLSQAKWENSDLTISSKLEIINKQMTWSVYDIVCLLADDIQNLIQILIFLNLPSDSLLNIHPNAGKTVSYKRATWWEILNSEQIHSGRSTGTKTTGLPFHQCLCCWILCLSAQRRFDLLRKRDPGVTCWAVIKLKRSDTGGVVWTRVRAGFRCQSVTSESQQQGCNISGIGRIKITRTVTSSLSYWPLFPFTLFHLTPRVSFWHRGHHPKPLISI